MPIDIGNDIQRIHAMGFLDKLLMDKTTGRRILWATDTYASLGDGYSCTDEIRPEQVAGTDVIRPRSLKAQAQQSDRTRQHGEVFTPLWVCRKMCDYADKELDGGDWKKYVDARVLEITCGEAPFLVSRYNSVTGEAIHVMERIGLLDRKLQAVNRNAETEDEWLEWTLKAFWATYGYEFQGDNLLIARVNLLMTFEEYLWERWKRKPTPSEYGKLINVIAWNVWQMDGLKGAVPYGTIAGKPDQISFFELMGETPEPEGNSVEQPPCRIYNWRSRGPIEFLNLSEKRRNHMKFDFIIGNPPYQEETVGDQKTFAPPIYHRFLDGAYQVGTTVELIHPARFLFNAGSTPKQWNRQMLTDPHLKVLYYEQDAGKVFNNTEIKGGVAITYHDERKDFGAIGTFTPYTELNEILSKVRQHPDYQEFSQFVVTRTAYRLTDAMHKDHPEAMSQLSDGHPYDMATNIFDSLPQIFLDKNPNDGLAYIQIYGRTGNERVYKYIRASYVNKVRNLDKWKVFVPSASGAGVLGEVLTTPVIAGPGVGNTETFISIGAFDTEREANSVLNYIKTKFARVLLGVLKITQHISPDKWKYVPLQDFTSASDIDWSKSIPEIDRQLYAKYSLDNTEIEFIESHVKEME